VGEGEGEGEGEDPLDDDLEDNDTREDAVPLAPGLHGDLVLRSEDEDWYAVQLCAGGTLTARILFSTDDGDLDLDVHDEEHGLAGWSTSATDDEEVLVRAGGTPATVFVLVYGYEGAGNEYALSLTVHDCGGGGGAGGDDRFEDNDSRQAAHPVEPGIDLDLVVRTGDEDWYEADACAGGRLLIRIGFLHASGDLDLVVYDGAGDELDRSETTGDYERVTVEPDAAGPIFARVFGYDGAENSQPGVAGTKGSR